MTTKYISMNIKYIAGLIIIAVIAFFPALLHAQGTGNDLVQGKVVTTEGDPLPGASVFIKGDRQHGVLTDSKGHFEIKMEKESDVLVVRFIGFALYEQKIGEKRSFDVVLHPNIGSLDSLTVIAYGTSSKSLVSSAISSVTAKNIADKPVTNAMQALQGAMAGVKIQQGTGAPGDQPQVRIRGVGSVSAGNGPLFVVDGVPLDDALSFNQINPSDIARIDVLKDAAAAALYGSRAGNGVVLVTTKRGKSGETRFHLNTYYGLQHVSKKVKVLNKEQYLSYVKDAFNNANRRYPSILDYPDSLGNVNWQDEIFGTAPYYNIELTASGGTDQIKFYTSAYKMEQKGILKGSGFQRYGFRTNLDIRFKSWLNMGINFAPNYSIKDLKPAQGAVNSARFDTDLGGSPSMGSPITLAILTPPIMPVYLSNGIDYASNYNWPYDGGNLGLPFNGQHYNPLQILDLYRDKEKSFRGVGNVFLELKPFEYLTVKTSIGGEIRSGNRLWTRPATLAWDNARTANITRPDLKGMQSAIIKGNGFNWDWETTANYKRTFNGKHNFDAIVGYSASKSTFEVISVTSRAGTATNTIITYPTNATTIDGEVVRYNENTLLSLFGRVQYNYNSKYLLSLGFRRDGSSRFGTANRFADFPSASAGWNVSREDFFTGSGLDKILSDFKIRTSWGKTGNYHIGDFARFGQFSSSNYFFGNSDEPSPGFSQSSFDLNRITWETNTQFDLGVDGALFNGRLSFTVDYYRRETKNLLLSVNVPALVGFTTHILDNVGEVRNKGLEVTLQSKNFVGAFSWNSNFNISFNKNKIIALYGDSPILYDVAPGYSGGIRQVVGGSLSDFWGLKQVGVYMNEEDLENSPRWEKSAQASQVGDIKYADVNGDGVIDENDITRIGSPHPQFTFGLSNDFSFRNFDLNVVLQGVYGGEIANAIVRYSNTFLGGDNPLEYALDRWRSVDNPGNGMIPRAMAWPGTATPQPLSQFSSYNLFSATYLRVKNLTLGYNFSDWLFKNNSALTARCYFTVQNLYTFSDYPGYNPDVNMYGRSSNDPRMSVDQGAYPLARTYVVGLNIGF